MVHARNVIRELFPRKHHKVKTITLSIVDEMMVERFERLQMALCTTIVGWCPTTPTLPRCLMHILMSRCLPIFGVSNTSLNTFTKVPTMLQRWLPIQQMRSNNTLRLDIWALLKGSIPYFRSKSIQNGCLSLDYFFIYQDNTTSFLTKWKFGRCGGVYCPPENHLDCLLCV